MSVSGRKVRGLKNEGRVALQLPNDLAFPEVFLSTRVW